MASPSFSCFVVGSDTLLMECTDHLLERGHDVRGVVTDTPRIALWAQAKGLAVIDPAEGLAEALGRAPFDHLFAITWLRILPDEILALPRGRAINFHDGPLPRYAGLNAPAWALMDGADTYGITWHLMTAGVDRGDLVLQRRFPIADDDTSLSLNMKCFAAAQESFGDLIDLLAAGRLDPEPQAPGQRSYFGRHDRPSAAGMLDWSQSAASLEARVRALNFGPYPNALGRAHLVGPDGRVWLAAEARATTGDSGSSAQATPGRVVRADAGGVVVATGDGTLTITRLEDLRGRPVALDVLPVDQPLGVVTDAEVSTLDEVYGRTARFEPFWTRRLESMDPAGFPDLAADDDATSTGERHRIDLRFPTPPPADPGTDRGAIWLAAWAAVTARLGRKATGDLAWLGAGDDAPGSVGPLFAPWAPCRVALDPDASFGQTVDAAARELETLRARGPFLESLFARSPQLRGSGSGTACPLPVGFRVDRASPSADVAVAGVAVALVVGADPTHGHLEFDPARLAPEVAASLARAVEVLVGHGIAAPERAWTTLPLVGDTELDRGVDEWNATAVPVADELLHHTFERRARTEPDRTALVFDDQRISYGELDRRANALAHRLREHGVGPDAMVGVYVPRSIELMVATLGVLKAGGAYLPLDPDFPSDRVAFMLEDAGARVVVTHGMRPQGTEAEFVDVGTVGSADAPPDGMELKPDHLAYVIYTSGSTGRPKGVMVEHRNVTNFFTGMDAVIRHDPPGVWLAVTSLSFDISVLELFWTLARGFEVVIHLDRERGAATTPTRRLDERGMRFGLFMWGNDDGPGRGKYRLMLDAGRYFDDNGFDSVWTPERHFHAFGGPFPNPSVTGAALAAITTRVAIRSGSCVSPLHHPIRIAEEWAVVDNLSDGRVGLSFAAGWQPNDFVLRPESYPDQKNVMIEQIDTVRRLWRGEAVEFTNPLGNPVAITTLPRPVQPELPFWITTAGNPESYRLAGRMGANVLTHLLGQTLDEVADKITAYRDARAEVGLDPDEGVVSLMLHTFVGDDDDEVRELVREPMKDYLRASMKLVLGFAWTFPAFKRPGGPDSAPEDIDLASLTVEESEAILEFAFDRYYEASGLFGTPGTCVDMVARCAAAGVDEIACLLDFGVDTDAVMKGLPSLKEVRDRTNASAEALSIIPASVPTPPVEDHDIAALIRRHGVTHLQCTPSMARILLERPDVRTALAGLEHVMIGGEAFPEGLARELRDAVDGRVTNMYGPTETTIWSTTHEVAADGPVPIGRPIANTQIHVLDPYRQPVPVGMPGELWIGGHGVVRGYHGRPELTAERFVDDPFVDDGGGGTPRMYWTGDLARYRADGVLEFLGRIDHQVKIRGYRIELGEIEARLEERPEVFQATVVLREDTPGDQRLVAYVTGSRTLKQDDLRRTLAAVLPPYMIPGHFVQLEKMPLTPNGKIDRKALPAPDAGTVRTGPVVAPANALEETLVEAWKEVLGIESVGTEDNFFDAGGHSLLVVQLHRVLTQRIDQPVSLVDLYRFPTIRSLGEHLTSATPAGEVLDASAARGARRRELMRQRRPS